MMKTLLSIDQGTTSSRAILFAPDGQVIASAQKELTLYYPHKGWVEQDAEQIAEDCIFCVREIARKSPEEFARCVGLGITNQRETTILWNREDGRPIYKAIVWQDRRTADFTDTIKGTETENMIREKTGLLADPYFSASKIKWILDHVDGARDLAAAGKLAFGTIDSYLIWRLSGGQRHVTCATNAARTMLFNIRTQSWDPDLLALFDIPESLLPEVHDNAANFGVMHSDIGGREITIAGVAGDQHAAMVGQACFAPGMVKSTYGTGCFALMNMGADFTASQNKLLTTPAYRLDGKVTYALEGSIFIAGAAIQWLRDNLRLFHKAKETQELALSVQDNNGVYFVPAFTGLGAPYWRPDVHAAIFGLSRESNFAHITRAVLEAQAYQTHDLFTAMEADSGVGITNIRADGGLVANEFMCGFLADILNIPVEIPVVSETTALGAAYLAGLQVGLYQGLDEISNLWQKNRTYTPNMSEAERGRLLNGWTAAIERLL